MVHLSLQELQSRPSTSTNKPLENGQTMDSSTQLGHPKEQDCTTSKNISIDSKRKLQKKNCQSVTAECLVADKKKTSKDKSTKCKKSSLTTKLSQTLAQELTSKDQVCVPFWNSRLQETSNKLWCPTEIDSVDLPLNCLNGYFNNMELNSWFLTQTWNHRQTRNLQKTFLPSLMFSIAELMEGESTKPKRKTKIGTKKKETTKTPNCVRKLRLRPNTEVYNIFKKWFGCVRLTYNIALHAIQHQKFPINMFKLRNRFVTSCNIPKRLQFLLETPKHIREGALTDLVRAFQINFQKGERFTMKYRSKKEVQSIIIPKAAIKILKEEGTLKMYPTYLKNALKCNVKNVTEVGNDCRLVMDKLGRLYLHVPMFQEVTSENQRGKQEAWAALDPGVRTFMTLYSPQGKVVKFGHNDNIRLLRLCKHLDRLISKRDKEKGRRKRRMKKAEQRLRYRIKNLVNDVHWKVINYLLLNFNNIVIPPFQVKEMTKKTQRVLSKKTTRCMYNWSHFLFRQRLIEKAKQHNVTVFVRTEEYTTKTCTLCGHHNNVKNKKVVCCSKCCIKVDRDIAGARNIFLKNVSMLMH